MESATTRNSYLNSDDFEEFRPESTAASAEEDPAAAAPSEEVVSRPGTESFAEPAAEPSDFSVAGNVWDIIQSDPHLRKQVNDLVDARAGEIARQMVSKEQAALLEQVTQEAKFRGWEQGREEGFAQGSQEVERLRNLLQELGSEFRKEKQRLLREHEKIWAEAFVHLARRFMVPRGHKAAELVRTWIRETVSDVETQDLIVKISPDDHELLAAGQKLEGGWRWMMDTTLKPGEIRCVSEMGTRLFRPGIQLRELDKMIRKIFSEETSE